MINLIVLIIIFACIAYGIWWVCHSFNMPQPVLWICGLILLLILFGFLTGYFSIPEVLRQ